MPLPRPRVAVQRLRRIGVPGCQCLLETERETATFSAHHTTLRGNATPGTLAMAPLECVGMQQVHLLHSGTLVNALPEGGFPCTSNARPRFGVPARWSVLIVESGSGIGRLLRDQLQDQGVGVTLVGSATSAFAVVEQPSFTVAILDMALPDGSGLEVLDRLRASRSVAHVIILSESPDEDVRVGALRRGADDYVVKPFVVRELTARVLAVRRRRDPEKDARLRVGPLAIDLRARQVRVDGRPLELTGKEFDLFAYLGARPGLVFSRDQLLRAVWQSARWTGLTTRTSTHASKAPTATSRSAPPQSTSGLTRMGREPTTFSNSPDSETGRGTVRYPHAHDGRDYMSTPEEAHRCRRSRSMSMNTVAPSPDRPRTRGPARSPDPKPSTSTTTAARDRSEHRRCRDRRRHRESVGSRATRHRCGPPAPRPLGRPGVAGHRGGDVRCTGRLSPWTGSSTARPTRCWSRSNRCSTTSRRRATKTSRSIRDRSTTPWRSMTAQQWRARRPLVWFRRPRRLSCCRCALPSSTVAGAS